MTDRFEVPEPSEKAMQALGDWEGQPAREQVHAILYADVPAIVRAEVERALKWANWANGNPIGEALDAPDLRYLAARYGEPTPKARVCSCPEEASVHRVGCDYRPASDSVPRPEGAPEPPASGRSATLYGLVREAVETLKRIEAFQRLNKYR